RVLCAECPHVLPAWRVAFGSFVVGGGWQRESSYQPQRVESGPERAEAHRRQDLARGGSGLRRAQRAFNLGRALAGRGDEPEWNGVRIVDRQLPAGRAVTHRAGAQSTETSCHARPIVWKSAPTRVLSPRVQTSFTD